jgi:hypothetical protein
LDPLTKRGAQHYSQLVRGCTSFASRFAECAFRREPLCGRSNGNRRSKSWISSVSVIANALRLRHAKL